MTSRKEIVGQNGNDGDHYEQPWNEGDEAAKQGLGRDANTYTHPDNRKLWEMGYFGITDEDMNDD